MAIDLNLTEPNYYYIFPVSLITRVKLFAAGKRAIAIQRLLIWNRPLLQIVDDWYHMMHTSVVKRSVEPHFGIQERLIQDRRVRRAEQQRVKSRTKRDLIIKRGPSNLKTVLNDDMWPQMWYLVSWICSFLPLDPSNVPGRHGRKWHREIQRGIKIWIF